MLNASLQRSFSVKELAITGPINVVTRYGVELKARARDRFFKEEVSATIISRMYEKPLIPTWYMTCNNDERDGLRDILR